MVEGRPKLSLRLGDGMPKAPDEDPQSLLTRAIEQRLSVRWTYNRANMVAGPQILYRKHDALYCDAVVVERDGSTPTETKLGSFNLAGLTGIKLMRRSFVGSTEIDLADPRYQGGILARVAG